MEQALYYEKVVEEDYEISTLSSNLMLPIKKKKKSNLTITRIKNRNNRKTRKIKAKVAFFLLHYHHQFSLESYL